MVDEPRRLGILVPSADVVVEPDFQRFAPKELTYYTSRSYQKGLQPFTTHDKPTGAVVGQQPFGGARRSGTNDKAGSALNLLRWVSARTVKETQAPPRDYRYPHMQ